MADAQLGRLVLDIVVDGGKMTAAFASGERQAKSFADKVSRSLSGVGDKLTLGVSAPLAAFGLAAVKAASDTSESLNKMRVVFRTSSAGIEAWAQNSARSFGMSKRAAYEAVGTFGNLFTSMGLGQGPAAEMSKRLVELAGDLASFNNVDPTEALDRLRSGLVGEAEPLRAWGVLLSEVAVKQEAYRLGLARTGAELTEAQKVQARYSLILQQTGQAQGDFARTADEVANSTRIAKAQFEDAAAALGTNLLPMATQGITTVNNLAVAFNGLDESTKNLIVDVGVLIVTIGPLLKLAGALTKVGQALAGLVGLIPEGLLLPGSLIAGGVAFDRLVFSQEAKSGAQAAAFQKAQNDLAETDRLLADAQTRYTQAMDAGDAAVVEMAQAEITRLTGLREQLKNVLALGQAQGALNATLGVGTLMAVRDADAMQLAARAAQGTGSLSTTGAGSFGIMGSLMKQYGVSQGQTSDYYAGLYDKQFGKGAGGLSKATDRIVAAFDKLATSITAAIDSAISAAKGLLDLTKGPGGGGLAPGANGPFERLYRVLDIAKLGGGSPWAAGEGLGQEEARRVGLAFEQGNLTAPGVFERIDWKALAAMTTQQQEGENLSEYAGQAVAGLMAAGKDITPEAVKQAVDELAAQDKTEVVPNLVDIKTAVGNMDANTQSNLAAVVKAVDGVAARLPAPPAGTVPPPPTPPTRKGGPSSFAVGTPFAPGGLAYVHAGELINLPRGSRVLTAGQTGDVGRNLIAALAGGAGGEEFAAAGAALAQTIGAQAVLQFERGLLAHFEGRP